MWKSWQLMMTIIHIISSIKYLSSMSLIIFHGFKEIFSSLGKRFIYDVVGSPHLLFFYVHHLHPLAFLIFIFMVMSTIGEHPIVITPSTITMSYNYWILLDRGGFLLICWTNVIKINCNNMLPLTSDRTWLDVISIWTLNLNTF